MRKRMFAPRLQVDVARALVEGVLPQPVHHLHHALVVGIELLVAPAKFHQLLEAGTDRIAATFLRRAHRLRQREELRRVALDVLRIGHDAAHGAARLALHLVDPVGHEGLGGGDHHLVGRHLDRQHAVAFGIGRAHDVGHLGDVHLQRVDAQVLHLPAPRQVLGEHLDVQRLAIGGARHGHGGETHQRMLRALGLRAARDGAARLLLRDHGIVGQPFHQLLPVQGPARRGTGRDLGLGLDTHARMVLRPLPGTRAAICAPAGPSAPRSPRLAGRTARAWGARARAVRAPRCCLRASV
jgi:hypothetical protein